MTIREELRPAYAGKTVLVTGHTGFKGSWLSEWLLMLGARVVGVALPPPTRPNLFDELGLADRLEHHVQDIRDAEGFSRIVIDTQPDFVFHLAAQPLVRLSYEQSVETYATNVMGTVHLLDALRRLNEHYQAISHEACAAVFITTDKCYANREWVHAYRETDALGGHDPYSSSKAAAELAIASFRDSFLSPTNPEGVSRVGVASARAGNVIGGGDWALDRIVPDCVAALERGETISVRNPLSTRPWQHVLEPLSGYLLLAQRQRDALLQKNTAEAERLCSAFNFGPNVSSNRTVGRLVEEIVAHWPGQWEVQGEGGSDAKHEAGKLNLAWDKAFHLLQWQPRWEFEEAVGRTVRWYRQRSAGIADPRALTHQDIDLYQHQAAPVS